LDTNETTPPPALHQFAHDQREWRVRWWGVLTICLLLLIPCVWHQRIEAGDLGSHVYNAWLAQQIERGKAPGLYLAQRWNNVLFDIALLRVGTILGWAAAEKIVVGASVLIFFWGAFAFAGAVAKRPPWELAPAFAMLAYGWTFQAGFFNYYISLGLAFLGIALFWPGKSWKRVAGIALLPLVWLAHPLGIVWFAAALGYILVREKIPGWYRLLLPVAAVLALAIVHWLIVRHFPNDVNWPEAPFYLLNGADQLALYGKQYAFLAAAVFFFCLGVFIYAAARRLKKDAWRVASLPLEMYIVAICAAGLLPQDLMISLYPGPMGLLVSRMTTVSAVLGLGVLACVRLGKWVFGILVAFAIIFFAFLYQDTAALNRLEANARALVSKLPPGQRVLATIEAPEDSSLPFINHTVDRACVERCYSYGNYEPASQQFRVRVREGSPIATADADESEQMASGEYKVRPDDLPIFEIFQCDPNNPYKLCLRALAAGELNGRPASSLPH
jgi:hypothetical protein